MEITIFRCPNLFEWPWKDVISLNISGENFIQPRPGDPHERILKVEDFHSVYKLYGALDWEASLICYYC